MRTPDIIEPAPADRRRWRLPVRLVWFAGIWAMSVAALAVVAFAIRWILAI